MGGTPGMIWDEPFWNATTTQDPTLSPDPITSFYVFWKSTTQSGTNGTALCTVGAAQYDFTVQTTNGQQIVTYTVTHTGDLPDTQPPADQGLSMEQWSNTLQLFSIAAATRSLLLGTISVMHGASTETPKFASSATSAAFFDPSVDSGTDFTWGNVARGIEQLSYNVSAAILTMDLGMQESSCAVTRQDIVFAYDRLNLWLPYGIALLAVALCLVLGILVFLRLNPENLSPTFSDTVGITRNSSLNAFAWGDGGLTDSKRKSRIRFRLGELKSGGTGFGMREDLKLE
ncbi:hypothetical protein FRC04_007877 [Tulasnella sp. 424]|nr:hypothetical protein FRC04_007877 [Tulasnella sp. 424]